MPKYVFKKVTEGKGRPSKFVEDDQGILHPWREWEKIHGKLSEVPNLEPEPITFPLSPTLQKAIETPVKEVNTEVPVVSKPVTNILIDGDRVIESKGNYVEYKDEGGHKTTFGSPVRIVGVIDSGAGFQDAMVVTQKGYRTFVKLADIVPPVVV